MAKIKPLREFVQETIRRYLSDLETTEPENLHQRLLDEIEPPLIEEILAYTGGNQSRTARILGITRNTLRGRIRKYGIKHRKMRVK